MTRNRFSSGVSRGIDQGGARIGRYVYAAASPQFNVERIDLPPGTRSIWIERQPYAAGQCFMFPGAPDGNLLAGAAVASGDRFRNAIDVTSFRLLVLDDPIDELYLVSTVPTPDVFSFLAVRGVLEANPGGTGIVTVQGEGSPAAIPTTSDTLNGNVFVRRGVTLRPLNWDAAPTSCAAGVATLIFSGGGEGQGTFFKIITAASALWIRLSNVAGTAGVYLTSTDPPFYCPVTGNVYAYNPGAGAVVITQPMILDGALLNSL